MAVAHVNVTTTAFSGTSGSPPVVTHTGHTVAAGSDRLLVVRIVFNNHATDFAETVDNVKWGSDALSFVGAFDGGNDDARCEIWQRAAPEVTTQDIVVEFTGASDANSGIFVGASNYTGVNQGTPMSSFGGDAGQDVSSVSVNVTSETDDLLISCVGVDQDPADHTPTGDHDTEAWDSFAGSGINGLIGVAGGRGAGTASATMSWSFSTENAAMAAANIDQAAADPAYTQLSFRGREDDGVLTETP